MKSLLSLFTFALLASLASAAQLTYEMRVDPAACSPGVVVSADHKSATTHVTGDVVGLQLFAIVNNFNANHADDGFSSGSGSFQSAGTLLGDLRGDVTGAAVTLQNNVTPFAFNGAAQSGFQADLDGDGDADVGSFAVGATPVVSPWFNAFSESVSGTFGSGTGDGPSEFLIGRTTFTVGSAAAVGQQTAVNFVPRNWTTGSTMAARRVHKFILDGISLSLTGNDPNLATGAPVVIDFEAAPVAPRLTYEMRVNPATCSAGVTVSPDHKNATVHAAGDVVGLQLYALVQNANTSRVDDGFVSGQGSFRSSSGGLKGDIRGDFGILATPQNNLSPFALQGVAQSGFQVDIDGDGDYDVGSNLTSGAFFNPLLWFYAVSELNGGAAAVRGVGTGTGPTEFLIGQTAFTVKAPVIGGTQTAVNFTPRVWNTAFPNSLLHKFLLDGVLQSLPGDSPAITVGVPVQIATPDTTPPTLAPVTISSDNASPGFAKAGDTLTVAFIAGEAIQTPTVTIAGQTASVSNNGGNKWKATLLVGAATPEGTAAFSIVATDLAGNTAAAVTTTSDNNNVIVDRTAPALTLPGTQVVEATSAAGATVNYPSADATDATAVTLAYSQASGTVFPLGDTSVTVTATDAAGNSASGDFTVTVQDTTPPAITHVPTSIAVTADATNHAPVVDFTGDLVATDNVGVTSVQQDPPAGTVVGYGPHTITLTVGDAADNVTSCTTTFTVDDGPALPGRYAGLLTDPQGAVHALMELKLTSGRFLTGYLRLDDGRRVWFPGTVLPATTHAETLALNDGSSLALTFDGFGHVAVTRTSGEQVLTVDGVLADAGARADVPGKYTAVLESGEGGAPGWLYAVVSSRGAMRISGKLPDGSTVSAGQGSIVDRHGDALIFILGKSAAHPLLAGRVHFENLATSDFTGALTFQSAPCVANGAKFTPAPSGLPAGAYPLALTGAGLDISSTVTLAANNTAAVQAPVVAFTPRSKAGAPATGLFYLTFHNPGSSSRTLLKGTGVFQQKLGIGVGQFSANGATGRVELGAAAPQ